MQSGGIPEGALSGQFTINSSGDKVYFSKGNLQYNKNTSTWSFMEHQYSTVETSYQDVGENYADQDVVSLFGWGNKYMMPYNTSTDYNEYGGRFVDWGTVAASSIGAGWRTLTGGTSGEWEYLINGRTVNGGKGNNYSYTLGQSVNGMLGIVLYPDNYTGATYTTAQSANWSSFEAAGCVFLPAAGWRSDT